MTDKQESDLRKLLSDKSKDDIIELFIILKKRNETYCDRIDNLEAHIDESTTLDKLIEDLP